MERDRIVEFDKDNVDTGKVSTVVEDAISNSGTNKDVVLSIWNSDLSNEEVIFAVMGIGSIAENMFGMAERCLGGGRRAEVGLDKLKKRWS